MPVVLFVGMDISRIPVSLRLHRHHGTGLFHTTIDERFGNSLPVQPSVEYNQSVDAYLVDYISL